MFHIISTNNMHQMLDSVYMAIVFSVVFSIILLISCIYCCILRYRIVNNIEIPHIVIIKESFTVNNLPE